MTLAIPSTKVRIAQEIDSDEATRVIDRRAGGGRRLLFPVHCIYHCLTLLKPRGVTAPNINPASTVELSAIK